jgi:hypothetical protein
MTQLDTRISPSGPIQTAEVDSSQARVTTPAGAVPLLIEGLRYTPGLDSTERVELSACAQGTGAEAQSIGITRQALVRKSSAGVQIIALAAAVTQDPAVLAVGGLTLIDGGSGTVVPQVTGVAGTAVHWAVSMARYPNRGSFV